MGTQKEAIKSAIKDELLGRYREMHPMGQDVLSTDWLYDEFLPSLSRKEEKALEEAIAEMIADGLIENVGGRKPSYQFTRKTRELLCLE